MTITKMNINDYEEIYTIWNSTKGMGLRGFDDSKDGIETFLNRNPETCFIAKTDEKIVGSILIG